MFPPLAGLAIAAALALFSLLDALSIRLPWWIGPPSTMAFYGMFYGLFEKKLWRVDVLHTLGLVKIPILDGAWKGTITTSFDEHAATHDVEVEISQTWTRIGVKLRGRDSKSHTLAATLLVDSPEGVRFSYEYRNEPLSHAVGSMQIHNGTARLTLTNTGRLEGEYYSGRGRQNFASIRLERKRPGLMA